jgi:hypothetical protein
MNPHPTWPRMTPTSIRILAGLGPLLLCLACGDPNPSGESGGTTDASTTAAPTTGPATTDASTTDATTTDATTAPASTGGETGNPAGAQCQADLQDCPDNFKCVLRRGEADWEFVCLPVQGDNAAGESCHHDGVVAGTDDCDEISWCIGAFDTTGAPWDGLCYPLCVGMVCEPELRCVGIGALPVCAPVCDPLSGSGCGSTEACIYRPPEGFVCFPQGVEGKQIGEICETGISCEAGLHCSQKVAGCAPEDFCCTDYCDTASDTNTCAQQADGATCVAIGASDPTQAHVGACVVPD